MAAHRDGSQHPSQLKLQPVDPAGRVCDSHVHVFDPRRFAYATPRRFTPGVADVARLREHMVRASVTRVVLVQPSVYGTSHDCLLDALAALKGDARGVAVLSAATSADEVVALDAGGVVAARLNLAVDHRTDAGETLARWQAIELCLPAHWHLQWHVALSSLRALAPRIERSPRLHVFDHFALPGAQQDVDDPDWRTLLDLLDTGKVYVKLSAPYLSSRDEQASHRDLADLVHSLVARRPDRLLWGSNWPHTLGTARSESRECAAVEPFRTHDDGAWREQCAAWAGPHAGRVLCANAQALYGFD